MASAAILDFDSTDVRQGRIADIGNKKIVKFCLHSKYIEQKIFHFDEIFSLQIENSKQKSQKNREILFTFKLYSVV